MQFFKYKNNWWEYISKDTSGNYIGKNFNDKLVTLNKSKVNLVKAKGFEDLDGTNTILDDKTQRTGWLSPEGKFYGCNYYNHSKQAEYLLKQSELQLEKQGWCRLSNEFDNPDKQVVYFNFGKNYERMPTKRQLQYLKFNGYETHYLYTEMKRAREHKREQNKNNTNNLSM
ncbi:MAG: hypothetical protein ACOCRX_06865 [Candidatus Woesearchaeota archaeon]